MSLPTPHIQAPSTYKAQWRAPASHRNISSPYSLAIPPRNSRRSANPSPVTEAPDEPKDSGLKLQVPVSPKKAVVVTEKPIRPDACNGKVTSTIFTDFRHPSPYIPAPKNHEPKWKMNDRVLALSVTLTLGLLLTIAIPLGIVLPQQLIKPLPVNVLIPFYVNPEPGAWDRLYNAIAKHQETNFTVIINPDNGPGGSAWPSGEYISAVKRLHVYPSVRTLGYIDTAGGSRDNATVGAEIARYAGWSNVSETLTLNGIFFDNTPFKDELDAKAYLMNISERVRHSEGFGERSVVAHNPGRVPDEGLMESKPNLTVIFEGALDDLPRKERLHAMLERSGNNRQDLGLFVHSVPKDVGRRELRSIVDDVRREIEWLFVTDLTEDFYKGYGSVWESWLDLI